VPRTLRIAEGNRDISIKQQALNEEAGAVRNFMIGLVEWRRMATFSPIFPRLPG
jgi:hypothetical protein